MTDDEFQKLLPKLTPRVCAGCTSPRFVVNKTAFFLVGMAEKPGDQVPTAPVFVVGCENCGHCTLYSIKALGLSIDPYKPPSAPAPVN